MNAVAMLAVIATMALALVRAVKGPTAYDRIVAVNMFGTKTVLLIAVAGFLVGRPDFLDLALVYALVNFTGVIAVLRFSRFGNLAVSKPLGGATERLGSSPEPVPAAPGQVP